MPNKLSQFWQELKSRNVIRAITVYAAPAFVILQIPSARHTSVELANLEKSVAAPPFENWGSDKERDRTQAIYRYEPTLEPDPNFTLAYKQLAILICITNA